MMQQKRVRSSEQSHLTTDVDAENKKGSSKRLRMSYTSPQLVELEKEYQNASYLDRLRRYKISQDLKLSEKQVKVWFQNRRMKDKIKPESNKSIKSNCNDISKRALSSSATTFSSEIIFEGVINDSEEKNDSSTWMTLTTIETDANPPGKHPSKMSSNNSQIINNEIFDQDIEILDSSLKSIFKPVTSDSESFLVTPAITKTVVKPSSTHPSNVSSNESPTIFNEFLDQCIKSQDSLESVFKRVTDDPLTWANLIIGKINGNLTCMFSSNVSLNNSPIINNEIIDQCSKMQNSSKIDIKTATNYSESPILETPAIMEIVANPSCMHPSNVSPNNSLTLDKIINEIFDTTDYSNTTEPTQETQVQKSCNVLQNDALSSEEKFAITKPVADPSCMHYSSNVSSNKSPAVINEIFDQDIEMQDFSKTVSKTVTNNSEPLLVIPLNNKMTIDEIRNDFFESSVYYSSTTESTENQQKTQRQKSSCNVLQNDTLFSEEKFAITETVANPSCMYPSNLSSNSPTLDEVMNIIKDYNIYGTSDSSSTTESLYSEEKSAHKENNVHHQEIVSPIVTTIQSQPSNENYLPQNSSWLLSCEDDIYNNNIYDNDIYNDVNNNLQFFHNDLY